MNDELSWSVTIKSQPWLSPSLQVQQIFFKEIFLYFRHATTHWWSGSGVQLLSRLLSRCCQDCCQLPIFPCNDKTIFSIKFQFQPSNWIVRSRVCLVFFFLQSLACYIEAWCRHCLGTGKVWNISTLISVTLIRRNFCISFSSEACCLVLSLFLCATCNNNRF